MNTARRISCDDGVVAVLDAVVDPLDDTVEDTVTDAVVETVVLTVTDAVLDAEVEADELWLRDAVLLAVLEMDDDTVLDTEVVKDVLSQPAKRPVVYALTALLRSSTTPLQRPSGTIMSPPVMHSKAPSRLRV
jgi:hypothetical protein